MDRMMERWMKGQNPQQRQDMMDNMMPKMMENCLTSMSREERQQMLSFCHEMLGEMEKKFGAST
jgi:hypothetical protein